MEVKAIPQPDAMQQQQIQALLANVEELTHQNEELWKTMESQNAERRRTSENQNEEESNSQANRWDRTSREDSFRMENEFHNMRKEMDELTSAMKDKAGGIFMGWFKGRTHHSPLKYWTIPSHQNFVSHNWNHVTVPRIPWITLNHSRH